MSQHELTTRIAYEIYVQRDFAPGRHREDWFAAETIVGLCLAFAAELARVAAPDEPQDETTLASRALELLHAAVAEMGRKKVATELGYKSPGSVGRYVRGDRPIGEELAQRILSTLGKTTAPKTARRAA